MNATLINASAVVGHRALYLWWCPSGHRNTAASRECSECAHSRIERHAQVHSAERAVVYRNPITGEFKRPPRADSVMPEQYQADGFERVEIMSMIQHERETGSVHEATNFAPGNEPSPDREPTPSVPKEVKEALIRDIREAHQSGAWTLDTPLVPES